MLAIKIYKRPRTLLNEKNKNFIKKSTLLKDVQDYVK